MVRILTDSSSDILPAEAEALGVRVVPLNVTFEDGVCVRDNVDLTNDEFYEKLRVCNKLPTTSQPSPEVFIEEFRQAKAAGDETVVLLVASSLSGTLQCAMLAADEADYEQAYFVDTGTVTMGLNLLVHRAVHLRDGGLSAAEIAASLDSDKDRIRIYAVLDELKYLHKGGRLPTAVALVGGALGIKPVVRLSCGKLGLAGKGRGLPGAFVSLFKLLDTEGGIDPDMGLVFGHTCCKSMAEPVIQYVTGHLHQIAAPLIQVGCTIGTHVGPKAAGLAYFCKAPAEQ